MATTITPVTDTEIIHATFIDLELGGTTYHLSTAERSHTIGGNVYSGLFSLLTISEISEDFRSTRSDVTITISGIPDGDDNYLSLFLTDRIKGGEVNIKRGFYNTTTTVLDTAEVYSRFQGVISNYGVAENTGILEGKSTHSIMISCVPIDAILLNQISGQYTNGSSRRKYYPADISFDRVQLITNKSLRFDK